ACGRLIANPSCHLSPARTSELLPTSRTRALGAYAGRAARCDGLRVPPPLSRSHWFAPSSPSSGPGALRLVRLVAARLEAEGVDRQDVVHVVASSEVGDHGYE